MDVATNLYKLTTCRVLVLYTNELQLSEKATKIPFPTMLSVWGQMSSSYFNQNNKLKESLNTEGDAFNLSLIMNTCENVNIATPPTTCF